MPRFDVEIRGKALGPAKDALRKAGIGTVGPGRLSGVLRFLRLSHGMTARLEADTAEDAEERVRAALPNDSYSVEKTKHV